MSFFAAIFQRDGASASRADIERMARVLASYAPGRVEVRTLGPVALAVLTETYTPEDRGQTQPVIGGGGRFSMLFDGRLDNRAELAESLGLTPIQLAALSDPRLAMRLFERWGTAELNKMVGEFAFIVWDETERQLIVVTDQLGRRGLVYHEQADRYVVASMVRPIHALADVPRELNEERLADSLSHLVAFRSETLFSGIHSCPAATVMTVSAERVDRTCYYRLRDHATPVRYKSDGEYVEAARAIFEEAVRACLRSDGPVGAFMSGGLDSATGAVAAASMLAEQGKTLPVFTWVPEQGWDQRAEPDCYGDETDYVRMIAAANPGIELNLVDSAGHSHYHRQDELLRIAEMPMRNASNMHWIHAILGQASGRGVRVMLQGTGGNMTLSYRGDDIYGELLRAGKLRDLWREMKRSGSSRTTVAARIALSALPEPLWEWVWRVRGKPSLERRWLASSPIRPAFGRATNLPARARQSGFNYGGRPMTAGRAGWHWLINQAGGVAATVPAAFRAMYRIDQRDPFLDRRIIEWCFGVPERQFHRDGIGRWLIKRMMQGRLPEAVLYKPQDYGRQNSDWHLRMSRDLARLQREAVAMAADPDLDRMIDIDRITKLLADFPQQTLTDRTDGRLFDLSINVAMALQVGRFVQIEKGSNDIGPTDDESDAGGSVK